MTEKTQHVPVPNRDHSDAWITCSCGWGSFGTDGEEWLAHASLELQREKEIRFLALMEASKVIRSFQMMFDNEGEFIGERFQDQLSLALEARQWPSDWINLATALVAGDSE